MLKAAVAESCNAIGTFPTQFGVPVHEACEVNLPDTAVDSVGSEGGADHCKKTFRH